MQRHYRQEECFSEEKCFSNLGFIKATEICWQYVIRAPRSSGTFPTSLFGKKTAFIIHKSIGIYPIKLTQEKKTFLYAKTLHLI